MPIYEFYCPDNHRIYSFFARSLAYAGKTPRCPDNPKHRMERVMSTFAVTGRAKEKPEMSASGGDDDPRMEAALAQMEREMGAIDEDNPNPRQLASMMRRMSEITGEKVPEQMEEMLGRLEAGENPEHLDEEMGAMLEQDPPEGAPPDSAEETKMKARLRRLRMSPRRDPTLYEMSEFVK